MGKSNDDVAEQTKTAETAGKKLGKALYEVLELDKLVEEVKREVAEQKMEADRKKLKNSQYF